MDVDVNVNVHVDFECIDLNRDVDGERDFDAGPAETRC
jgi:hypothetical protein